MIASEPEARAFVGDLCDPASIERLDRLVALLAEENERQNLVARATMDTVWQRHIADSAQLLLWADGVEGEWLDLGSGAGFPGLVVAAMRPDMPIRLVESRKRRIEWLNACIEALGLRNCTVEGARLEAVEAFPAAVISARAFAPLDKLLRLSARFSTSDTLWLLPKGRSAGQELDALQSAGRAMFHVEHSLTDAEAGIVVGRGAWKGKA